MSTPNSLFKTLSLLVMVSLFSINNSYGQCLQTTPWYISTLSTVLNGSGTSACIYAGEYGTWNGAITDYTYTFSSTNATDFLTISEVPGGPALAWGTQPLVYTSSATGTLYVHVSTNSACGTSNVCRGITGTTTAFATGCTNVISFGTGELSAVLNGFQTIPCTYGGEYGTWNNAITGYAYNFSSTVATDFLTIHTGASNGPIVASGIQPLSWISNTTGTIYVHVNTDSACGTDSNCRDITGTTPFLVPSSGSNTLPCGQTTTLCSHAGCGQEYDNNVDGFTVLNAFGTATVNVNGSYDTESGFDFITIYEGSGTGGTVLYGPVSGSGTLDFTSLPSQTLTLRFSTNNSVTSPGFSFAITYVGDCAVTAIPLCVTSPTAPANGSTICPSVTLSWPFVVQAQSYDVYLNTGAGPATTLVSAAQMGSSYSTGLLAGSTSYSWRVVPKNSLGDAVGCSDFTFTTIAVPAEPTGLSCYQTATLNATTCVWDVTGTQPIMPSSTPNINVTITSNCIIYGGEYVNSGLLNGHYDFQNVYDGYTYHISFNGSYWVLWVTEIYITVFFNTSPSNGLYPPTTGWIPTPDTGAGCEDGTLTWGYASPLLACYQTTLFNQTTCVWDISGTQPIMPSSTPNINVTIVGGCYDFSGEWVNSGLLNGYYDFQNVYNGLTYHISYDGVKWVLWVYTITNTGFFNASPSNGLYPPTTGWIPTGCSEDGTLTWGYASPPLACYQTTLFNQTTCVWDISGTQPTSPATPNINVAITNDCIILGGEWVNSGLLNGHYDFQNVYNGYTYHISYDGVQWVLWVNTITNIGFFSTSPSNGLYPPTTGWIPTGSPFWAFCSEGTLTLEYPIIPTLGCNESYVFNTTSCVWDLVTDIPCESIVNLKLFVEGYYQGGGLMSTVQNNQDYPDYLLPLNTNVENITVELRDALTTALVASTTAMLKTDGTAVCSFPTAPSGSFYIAVKTRNTVETWSALPQTVGVTPLSYDFTTAASQAYGDNQASLGGGVFGFYSGDIDSNGAQDGEVNPTDYSEWEAEANAFLFGSYATDLNGDGEVNPTDYSIWESNANAFIFSLYPAAP